MRPLEHSDTVIRKAGEEKGLRYKHTKKLWEGKRWCEFTVCLLLHGNCLHACSYHIVNAGQFTSFSLGCRLTHIYHRITLCSENYCRVTDPPVSQGPFGRQEVEVSHLGSCHFPLGQRGRAHVVHNNHVSVLLYEPALWQDLIPTARWDSDIKLAQQGPISCLQSSFFSHFPLSPCFSALLWLKQLHHPKCLL